MALVDLNGRSPMAVRRTESTAGVTTTPHGPPSLKLFENEEKPVDLADPIRPWLRFKSQHSPGSSMCTVSWMGVYQAMRDSIFAILNFQPYLAGNVKAVLRICADFGITDCSLDILLLQTKISCSMEIRGPKNGWCGSQCQR